MLDNNGNGNILFATHKITPFISITKILHFISAVEFFFINIHSFPVINNEIFHIIML